MWLTSTSPAADGAAALTWALQQRARWDVESVNAVVLPWFSQGWSTLGACTSAQQVGITETDSSIPPLKLFLGRSDILQSMSGIFMLLLITQGCPGQCSCHSRLGLQHILSQQELSRGSLQPPFGSHSAVLPSFHLQLFKTYLAKSHLLLAKAKCYLSQQSEISPIFPQTFLTETLKGYLQVAATFSNWIPPLFSLLCKIATSWLQKHNLVTSLACLI